jgi:hypothetical protein
LSPAGHFAALIAVSLIAPVSGAVAPGETEPQEAACPMDGPLAGVWASAEGDRMVRFSGSATDRRYALVLDGRLDLVAPVVACRPGRVETCSFGRRHVLEVAVEGDRLEFQDHSTGEATAYRRVDGVPEVFDPRPLELPDPVPLPVERVAEIQAELARRLELDQEVRVPPYDGPTMMRVDADNTAYLKDLVGQLGWIAPGRFGDEAADAAFLIVQHSGDLPLMLAALPHLRTQERLQEYALLFDRLQIRQGLPQRYGTQIGWAEDGTKGLLPIETLEEIDAIRAELGLPPLDDYLAHFDMTERRVLDCR